ncbi:MAG: hypothetical protein NWF00_09505 [Candidatus Bathyarchaeota archaeon]|nr:hypothetical protein [Candidatus Bathyarchaeota archaeon]
MSEDKKGYSKAVQSVYNSRIKKSAKQALQDLALLAQKLPEEQQTEIFNDQNVGSLLAAILKISPEENAQLWANKGLAKRKRERLLPLTYALISRLNDSRLAHLLAPVGTRYMVKEGGHLAFLKAVYYRSFNSIEDEE